MPGTHVLPGAHAAFADHAVDRRHDARVAERDPGQRQHRLLGLEVGPQLQLLGVEHRHLATLGFELVASARQRRLEALLVGGRLLEPLAVP